VRESLSAGFRNEKHKAQWKSTLETYAAPLRAKPVDIIATDDVLAVLKPIWTTKAETASRVRGRIEKVLDAAKAKGFREGENPARWRGHLDHLLPRPSKLSRGHHAAMPYEEVAAFIAKLRAREATSAVVILRKLERLKTGEFVFPGQARNKPLSGMAMEMVLRRMKIEKATVHGFRSSFRDWAGNVSSAPREIVETALAHVIGDKAEQAYRRSDALEKRRKLMEAWATYCEKPAGNVVNIRERKSR
jgi:integrase